MKEEEEKIMNVHVLEFLKGNCVIEHSVVRA